MKTITVTIVILLLCIGSLAQQQQQDDKITVSKSLLTADQIAQANQQNVKNGVSSWAGLGKEVGEAVNSGMAAITTQSNNFAQTGVGKLTIGLIVWKVLGDQLIHFIAGIGEILIFVPLWVWSYRRTCMTRRFYIGKDENDKWKYEVVEYKGKDFEFTPRCAHALAAGIFAIVVLITVFSY